MNRFFIQMTRTTIKWYNLTHALGDCWVKHICKIVQQFNSNSTLWCLLSTSHAIIPYFRKISFQRFQGFQDDLQIGTEPRRPQAASLWFPTGVPFSSQGRYICNNYYLISDILHLSCFLSLLDLLKAWGVVNMLSCSCLEMDWRSQPWPDTAAKRGSNHLHSRSTSLPALPYPQVNQLLRPFLLQKNVTHIRSVLSSVDLKEGLSVSVTATSSSLTMLLHLLSTGFVVGRSREEVAEVQEAAKALGLILGDCQVVE